MYKAGILKRANLLYKDGAIDDAEKKLIEGFHIASLIREFAPEKWKKMQMAEKVAKALEGSVKAKIKGLEDLKKKGVESLSAMKESVMD